MTLPVRAIKDSILFTFLDETKDGQFVNLKTKSGIVITRLMTDNGKLPRWALAFSVGPKVVDVKAGDYILIEPLQWTPGEKLEGQYFWRTTEAKVLATATDVPDLTL